MELFQCRLAAQGVDPLAHGVGHLAEPSIENVENRLAGFLEDAFLETFLETFLDTFLKPPCCLKSFDTLRDWLGCGG